MQYNYNYGDGGIVDEQTAEFAQMQDGFKQANKDSKGETWRVSFCLDVESFRLLTLLSIPPNLQRLTCNTTTTTVMEVL